MSKPASLFSRSSPCGRGKSAPLTKACFAYLTAVGSWEAIFFAMSSILHRDLTRYGTQDRQDQSQGYQGHDNPESRTASEVKHLEGFSPNVVGQQGRGSARPSPCHGIDQIVAGQTNYQLVDKSDEQNRLDLRDGNGKQ